MLFRYLSTCHTSSSSDSSSLWDQDYPEHLCCEVCKASNAWVQISHTLNGQKCVCHVLEWKVLQFKNINIPMKTWGEFSRSFRKNCLWSRNEFRKMTPRNLFRSETKWIWKKPPPKKNPKWSGFRVLKDFFRCESNSFLHPPYIVEA